MVRKHDQGTPQPLGITTLSMAIGVGAAILIGGTFVLVAPPVASAKPQFAVKTKLPCAQCHTKPPALTAFGKKFKANGFKVK